METIKAKGYGAKGSFFNGLSEMDIERKAPAEDEVQIDVLYCGVCHSDLHQVKNDWGNTLYPCVPGHEVVGRVVRTGSAVSRYKVGDLVGVGCMIDSCGSCEPCRHHEENYCEGPVSFTATYNGYMKPDGSGFNTYGGYSTTIVVKESFVLRIPESLDVKAVAPILCAGITTYSPLKHWGVREGSKVGIAGLGGLGHMAVKLAKALGASHVVLTTDAKQLEAHALSLDFILVTIPDAFELNDYVPLLRRDGALVTVGLLGEYKKALNNMEVALHRRSIAGSLIGGIQETQEVLDFCAEHHILPEVELIRMQDINKAFDKLKDEQVRFRYVIDMASLKEE